MTAEGLIDLYLEAKDPQVTKFAKQLDKGVKVKADTLLDLPFRDTDQNVDQDSSRMSSSTAPYR